VGTGRVVAGVLVRPSSRGCSHRPAATRPARPTTTAKAADTERWDLAKAVHLQAHLPPSKDHTRVPKRRVHPASTRRPSPLSREARDVLSYRYATSPDRAVADTPSPKVLLSRAISAMTARRPFASHSAADVVGCNGSGRRLTSVCAGQSVCGAPRRNRTGDPILTMDRQPSAVLTAVFAGRTAP
jgi:hypothetical protein